MKLVKNQKNPIKDIKWKSSASQGYHIPSDKYNIGIPTGRNNNLIVVDVDIKKEHKKELDGVPKIKEYGAIDTLTIRTPSGGTHYYFKYNDSNENIKFIIKNYLYTRSGVGGYSIDIRAEGGYIVAPPSAINGKNYEITNFSNIANIPESLAAFLKQLDDDKDEAKIKKLNIKINRRIEANIESETTEEDEEQDTIREALYFNNRHILDNFVFAMDDAKIKELLDMLPNSYDNEFFKYMTITTILKAHDKFTIWNDWSKKNKTRYNYKKNIKVWNWCLPIYTINLLVYILKNEYHKEVNYIKYYKKYEPTTFTNYFANKLEVNNEFVSDIWTYDDFLKYDIHIIKSTTGTGKTTATAGHMEQLMKANADIKFITLTTRTMLSDQHKETFKNVKLASYQDVKNLYKKRAITICINSLERLSFLDDDDMRNYILYIDEVSSFLEFTHNETLKHQRYGKIENKEGA